MRLGEWCATAGRRLLDSVLPPLCLGCNEIVAEPGALCATCWPAFSFIAAPMCARCGVPFAEDIGENAQCGACLRRPPRYLRARSALVYDDRSRRLVLPFKHGDRTDMAKSCGLWMARAGRELLQDADMLIPVPLHWRRAWHRRYNQSGALARVIEHASGVKLRGELLQRVRPTEQQVGLSRPQRASNVQGAFKVPADRQPEIAGRRVILIDDVLTSGATADACARALLRAKAVQVDVLVFARVVDSPRAPI